MKLAVVTVPFILSDRHKEWAEETIKSVRTKADWESIAIVNAYRKDSDDTEWLKRTFSYFEMNDRNNLARAWNKGASVATTRGANYILFANLDVVFHPECIDRLLSLATKSHENLIWSASSWFDLLTLNYAELVEGEEQSMHWSCFLVHKDFFKKVGPFDEQFEPAYLEDSDMRRRMALLGIREKSALDAIFYHMDRASIKGVIEGDVDSIRTNITFFNSLADRIKDNERKYKEKWGGPPYKEIFNTPYNK